MYHRVHKYLKKTYILLYLGKHNCDMLMCTFKVMYLMMNTKHFMSSINFRKMFS